MNFLKEEDLSLKKDIFSFVCSIGWSLVTGSPRKVQKTLEEPASQLASYIGWSFCAEKTPSSTWCKSEITAKNPSVVVALWCIKAQSSIEERRRLTRCRCLVAHTWYIIVWVDSISQNNFLHSRLLRLLTVRKMGRSIRKHRPKNPKRAQQGPYKDIVRENDKFDEFYKAQVRLGCMNCSNVSTF